MKTQKASHSACIIAAHRAFESSKDAEERVCYDPFAERFLPSGFTVIGAYEIPGEVALKLFQDLVPGFHEFFIARTRYIDDYLLQFINKGLEQLVILGAGYDSRAYRLGELKNKVNIFEVDHPATQSVKKEKLREIFQVLPDHVTYVPVDFHKDNLPACLSESGYDRHLTTLFIWEGVTMYVAPAGVDETLAFISQNSGKGSAVIFDYTYHEVVAGAYERKEAQEWLKIAAKSDEPLLFGIRKGQTAQFLSERNFSNICNITSEFFKDTYFIGVNQGRESTPILCIAHAEMKNHDHP